MELLSQEGIAGAQRPHPPGVTSPCPEELPADKKHFSSLHEAEELAGPFGGAPGPETPKSDTQVRKPSPASLIPGFCAGDSLLPARQQLRTKGATGFALMCTVTLPTSLHQSTHFRTFKVNPS